MRASRILGQVGATVLAAAGLLLVPSAGTAAAPECPGASGITVVVDFNELPAPGGRIQAGCDPDGGGRAASNFADAGFQLTNHPTQQGYVCQVSGMPADGECIENDAFWSLWWSDGKSGKWVFSGDGAYTLKVPTGGYVAFAWHEGGGRAGPPDAVPTPRQPTATPTPTPDAPTTGSAGDANGGKGSGGKGSGGGGGKGSGPGDDRSPQDSPSASSQSPSSTPSTSSTASASASTSSATPTEPSSSALPGVEDITDGPVTDTAHLEGDDENGSFPTWVAAGLAVGVLGAAGAVPLIRRRLG